MLYLYDLVKTAKLHEHVCLSFISFSFEAFSYVSFSFTTLFIRSYKNRCSLSQHGLYFFSQNHLVKTQIVLLRCRTEMPALADKQIFFLDNIVLFGHIDV